MILVFVLIERSVIILVFVFVTKIALPQTPPQICYRMFYMYGYTGK